jgi:hypothetical protein
MKIKRSHHGDTEERLKRLKEGIKPKYGQAPTQINHNQYTIFIFYLLSFIFYLSP